jgi:hypothetical protein
MSRFSLIPIPYSAKYYICDQINDIHQPFPGRLEVKEKRRANLFFVYRIRVSNLGDETGQCESDVKEEGVFGDGEGKWILHCKQYQGSCSTSTDVRNSCPKTYVMCKG